MKLKNDCIRDILLVTERECNGNGISIGKLSSAMIQYSTEEVNYHCLKLYEANFLDLKSIKQMNSVTPCVIQINDLTFAGHEFLEEIRSDETWDKAKKIAEESHCTSLRNIERIAVQLNSK